MMTLKVAVIAPRDEARQNQLHATKTPPVDTAPIDTVTNELAQHRYRHVDLRPTFGPNSNALSAPLITRSDDGYFRKRDSQLIEQTS